MKRLSDINTCSLEGFPKNTKKEYSGLVCNWIYELENFNFIKNYKYESWKFGWKQKVLKESFDVDYYNYKKSKHKQYLIWDYNSCFIIFKIHVWTENNKVKNCRLSLFSTDDGDFFLDFDYKHLDKVKSFFKNNYKHLTLEKIETYINNLI